MKQIVLLIFVLSFTFLFAVNWTYEMEKISLPTGTSGNEIYIYDAPDHLEDAPDEGPTKFQIDEEGNIAILTLNKIKKFDAEGKFLDSTQQTDLIITSFVICQNIYYAICWFMHAKWKKP